MFKSTTKLSKIRFSFIFKSQCDSLNPVSVLSFNLAGSAPLILSGEEAQLFGFSLELRGRPGQPSLYVGDPLHLQLGQVTGAVFQCR